MFFLHWKIVFFAIASFDLWMSKGAYDVLALVIKILTNDW
jgi:hypothetical protein